MFSPSTRIPCESKSPGALWQTHFEGATAAVQAAVIHWPLRPNNHIIVRHMNSLGLPSACQWHEPQVRREDDLDEALSL